MVIWRAVGVLLVAVGSAGLSVAAQSQAAPPTPTGLIMGTVVDAESQTPIPGAMVQLVGVPGGLRALTDAEGRFAFRQLPASSYTMTVTTGGNGFSPAGFLVTGMGHPIAPYLNGSYGQRRPGGPAATIQLPAGGMVADAEIRLWKPGAIDGVVVDESGEPLVDLVVAAVRRRPDGSASDGPTTRTDDRGMYHFGTLTPGDYVIVVPQTQVLVPGNVITTDALALRRLTAAGAPVPSAAGVAPQVSNALAGTTREGRRHVYRSTFHPSVHSVGEAQVITVHAGEHHRSVDVTMVPTPAGVISGVVLDGGAPVAGFGLRLHPTDIGAGAEVLELAWTATDAVGRFTFPEVPVGTYRIEGQRRTRIPSSLSQNGQPIYAVAPTTVSEQPGAWTSALVTVGETPVPEVVLSVQAPLSVKGTFVMDGKTPLPATEQEMGRLAPSLNVMPVPVPMRRRESGDGASNAYTIQGFETTGLMPGAHRFNLRDAAGVWTLQSITMGGRDMVDVVFTLDDHITDVVVTFTDQPAEISGTVSGDHAGASVYLYPADRQRWGDAVFATHTVRAARVDAEGRFRVPRVIPGEYLIIAALDTSIHEWPDPAWLARASGAATRVTVTAKQQQVLPLTVREVK
jgi:hypothetical protein